jgi:hypothetical protein
MYGENGVHYFRILAWVMPNTGSQPIAEWRIFPLTVSCGLRHALPRLELLTWSFCMHLYVALLSRVRKADYILQNKADV